MAGLKLDFVVYLGDPDDGATAIASSKVLDKIDEHKSKLNFAEGVYGAITIEKNGKLLGDRRPDPAMSLITSFVKAIPFLIDGEPERVLLAESEYGFLFEPAGDDVLVSHFAGDVYEPDEYLIEREAIPLETFADQVIAMGDRLVKMIKVCEPALLDNDDYSKTLLELLDMARGRHRMLRLEREKGVRR